MDPGRQSMTGEEGQGSGLLDSSVFEGISPEKLSELADAFENIVVPAGTVVIRQGDPGDNFYIINSGRVRVYKKDEEGLETEFAEMGYGDSFGEMSLLTGQQRAANVETLDETHLTVISKEKFNQILKDHPQVSMKFINQLSSWLLREETRLQEHRQLASGRPGLSWMDFAIIMAISLAFAFIFNQSNPNRIKIIPETAMADDIDEIPPSPEMSGTGAGEYAIIDARPVNFYDERHIKDSIHIPYAMFDVMYMIYSPEVGAAEKIVVSGRTISRRYDVLVARKLRLAGHENVFVLKGGMKAWRKEGLPTEP
jgi:CRP-like cAMP-binding protein